MLLFTPSLQANLQSYQAEEEPTNFALMAFSSSSSNSSSDCEFRKSKFDVMSYQTDLKSVEARLLVYKKNESVLEENIKLLNIEVQLRAPALATLRKKLETTEKDRDDLNIKDIHKHHAQMKYSKISLHKVSATVPSKSKSVLTTAARTIRTVKPKFSKARPNITPYAVSKSKLPFRKPFIRHTSPKPSISPHRVNAANPSAVSAARVNAAVSAAKINAVKPSAVTAV
nr:hypothetical protein [Tanacetum cinerariifolium]